MTETDPDDITPVIFRKESDGDITVVFPTVPSSYDNYHMTCFAHIGQHSGCTMQWYDTTTPATPEEYADLKRELEAKPYEYKLKVYQRITKNLRKQLRRNASGLR